MPFYRIISKSFCCRDSDFLKLCYFRWKYYKTSVWVTFFILASWIYFLIFPFCYKCIPCRSIADIYLATLQLPCLLFLIHGHRIVENKYNAAIICSNGSLQFHVYKILFFKLLRSWAYSYFMIIFYGRYKNKYHDQVNRFSSILASTFFFSGGHLELSYIRFIRANVTQFVEALLFDSVLYSLLNISQ